MYILSWSTIFNPKQFNLRQGRLLWLSRGTVEHFSNRLWLLSRCSAFFTYVNSSSPNILKILWKRQLTLKVLWSWLKSLKTGFHSIEQEKQEQQQQQNRQSSYWTENSWSQLQQQSEQAPPHWDSNSFATYDITFPLAYYLYFSLFSIFILITCSLQAISAEGQINFIIEVKQYKNFAWYWDRVKQEVISFALIRSQASPQQHLENIQNGGVIFAVFQTFVNNQTSIPA